MECQNGVADGGTGTLTCLPRTHRNGLIAVGAAATISSASTTALFLFLSYKLFYGTSMKWRRPTRKRAANNEVVLDTGERQYTFGGPLAHQLTSNSKPVSIPSDIRGRKHRNPFPILVYNLLLAEMQTSLGYTLNIEWVVRNGVFEGTSTCWVQGWLNNIGILASSIFLASISVHTYLSVVRGVRLPQRAIHVWIALCWILAFALTSAGIIATNNGASEGGWFVRANTWCWVNPRYGSARLWGEWAWILASIPVTIVLYGMVFWSLYRENRCCRYLPRRCNTPRGNTSPSGYHPAFLVYPFVYLACISPLAIARLITICGGSAGTTYYCVAGLMVATNGFWNTILWLSTMFFSTQEDMHNTGLDQFAFIRTPKSRRYGNMVWINGPASKGNAAASVRGGAGWWWWRMGGQARWQGHQSRNISQQSLRREMNAADNSIHLDVITTVVVEENTETMTDTIHSASTGTCDKKVDEYLPRIPAGKFGDDR